MFNPFKTNQRLKDLQSEVDCLRDLLQKHATTMAHELFKLKNPWYERSQSTVGQPLTEEQEKIVREFNENRKLPEQIRRGFASGGHIGMRAALGRFGEAPSEQTRSTDDVYAYEVEPGNVNVQVQFSDAEPQDERSQQLRRQFDQMLNNAEINKANLNEGLDVLVREEQAMMDREAWDQLDLDDIGKPKE